MLENITSIPSSKLTMCVHKEFVFCCCPNPYQHTGSEQDGALLSLYSWGQTSGRGLGGRGLGGAGRPGRRVGGAPGAWCPVSGVSAALVAWVGRLAPGSGSHHAAVALLVGLSSHFGAFGKSPCKIIQALFCPLRSD